MKNLTIILFTVLVGCSSTIPEETLIFEIENENATIESLQVNYELVKGSGKLVAKGSYNFISSFIFESSSLNNLVVFKDFIGRKSFAIDSNEETVKLVDLRKNIEITSDQFTNEYPQFSGIFFEHIFIKKLLWGEKIEQADYPNLIISQEFNQEYGMQFLNQISVKNDSINQDFNLSIFSRNFE
jgi:hypothetical protein